MNGLAGAFVKIWDKDPNSVKQDSVLKTDLDEKKIIAYTNQDICGSSQEYVDMSGREFGPFKGVFDKKQDNAKHNNTDVFNFIKEDYRMFEEIGFETSFDTNNLESNVKPKKKNKNFRLFAFGYSGSGKTYTLVKGGTLPDNVSDPSVMKNTIRYLIEKAGETEPYTHEENLSNDQKAKTEHWKHVDGSVFEGIDINIYYPLEHNDISEESDFTPISLNNKGNIPKKLDEVLKMKSDNLESLSGKIQNLVDEFE